MQGKEETKELELKTMPVAEQILFLVDTETERNETAKFKDRKESALLGALVADLLLLNKVRVVRNKLEVTAEEGSSIKYMDEFIRNIRSLPEQKRIENVIDELKPVAERIEEKVKKKLLAEEWLREKKGFNHVVREKEVHIENSDYLKALRAQITKVLEKKQEPSKKIIYLLALLDAIKLLKNFTEEEKLGREERTRLKELLEKEPVAKKIHKAIKTQEGIKLLRLKNIGSAGYLGIVNNQSIE